MKQELAEVKAEEKSSVKRMVGDHTIRLLKTKEGHQLQITSKKIAEGADKGVKLAVLLDVVSTLSESTLNYSGVKYSLLKKPAFARAKMERNQLLEIKKSQPEAHAQAMKAIELEGEKISYRSLYAAQEPKEEKPAETIKSGLRALTKFLKGEPTPSELRAGRRAKIAEKLADIQSELDGLTQDKDIRESALN